MSTSKPNMASSILLAITLLLSVAGLALPEPIQPPDFSKCQPITIDHKSFNCCPPVSLNITDFITPPPSEVLRVRHAAHLVGKEYIEKYNKATNLMKNLDPKHPWNFMQQANVHCAYCDAAYSQATNPDLELQIHSSWLFFPFHRAYLYFYERILGKLIGDDNFALPFWNWDSPDGMEIPKMYVDASSAIYDKFRNANHQPPVIANLNYNDSDYPDPNRVDNNLKTMYRQMVSGAKTPRLFFGKPYREGDKPNPGAGSIEMIPHNLMHLWTSDPTQPNNEDMGSFYSAGRDPIFFAHHANLDRMWVLWGGLPGRLRKNYQQKDWLDTAFLFYDENMQLVKVKVGDLLDTQKLGYVYQDVPLPWLHTPPTKAGGKKPTGIEAPKFPLILDRPKSLTVKRPQILRTPEMKQEQEEVLVVDDIELDSILFSKFDVYINAGADNGLITPSSSEFAGSFDHAAIAHRGLTTARGVLTITQLNLGLTDLLDSIGADGDDDIVVAFVPQKGNVTIGGVRIEFLSDSDAPSGLASPHSSKGMIKKQKKQTAFAASSTDGN